MPLTALGSLHIRASPSGLSYPVTFKLNGSALSPSTTIALSHGRYTASPETFPGGLVPSNTLFDSKQPCAVIANHTDLAGV